MRDYQREHDLEATGTLTLPTLAALGIDVTSKPGQSAFSPVKRSDGTMETEEEQDAVATSEPRD